MDTLGIYNSALAAAVNHLATAITAVIGASYDPTDARGSIDRMTPEITELVRAARAEAYEAAATAIRAFAAEQGVTAPYVPAMPGYPEAAVRASLRESLMVSRDPSGRTAALRLSQHARDAARQTVMRTVEDGREAAPGVDRAYSALDETPRPVEDMPRDPEDEKDAPTGRRDHLSVVRDPDDEKEVQSDDGPRGFPKLDRTSTEYLQGRIEDPMREMVEVHAKSWARVLTGAENCPFCVMLASRGPVYRSADDAGRLDASEMLDDADAGGYVNTYHPNCVTGDTLVSGPETNVAMMREFEGEVIDIRTAGGRELTITPNHPVLTSSGWKPAGLLDEGDDLVCSPRADGDVVRGPHEDHAPARIEDLARALAVSVGLGRVPGSAEQFHGDGVADSEVHVVGPHGLLRDVLDPALVEPGAELIFEMTPTQAAVFGELLDRSSAELLLGTGDDSSSDSGVSGFRLALSLLLRHLRRPDSAGLTGASLRETGFPNPSVDDVPGDSGLSGECVHAFSLAVPTQDVGVGGELSLRLVPVGVKFDPRVPYESRDGVRVYAELGADLRARLAGDVELDRVVGRSSRDYSGHVYNLSTVEGWYNANGITVSNCDCLVVPVYSWKSWPGRDSWLEAKRIYDAAAKEELALPEDERTQADNFMIGALDKYLRRHRDDGDPMERISEIPAVPRLAVA